MTASTPRQIATDFAGGIVFVALLGLVFFWLYLMAPPQASMHSEFVITQAP